MGWPEALPGGARNFKENGLYLHNRMPVHAHNR